MMDTLVDWGGFRRTVHFGIMDAHFRKSKTASGRKSIFVVLDLARLRIW
jgi:hypothetical protein